MNVVTQNQCNASVMRGGACSIGSWSSLEDMPGDRLESRAVKAEDMNTHQRQLSGLAREGLAERLGVKPDQVQVVSYEDTTFSGATLGISEPGWGGATVMTDGYIVSFKSGEKDYEYRAAHGGSGKYLEVGQGFAEGYRQDERGIYVAIPSSGPHVW